MTSTEHADAPVASLGAGIDASQHPQGFQGVAHLGGLLGLQVGSGAPPTETVTPDPFPDADQFTLTKPVNGDQLTDELTAALERKVLISIGGASWDPNMAISDTNQATLWLTPSGLDASRIETVIANHTPVDVYNTTKLNQDFSAALTKIQNNDQVMLTPEEANTVIIGLALDYLKGQTTTVESSFTPSGGTA